MDKIKIILVGGPTASGKTKVALDIAKEFKGELINADSRQIYKLLNIGTNKGNILEHNGIDYLEEVPIHLINLINPDKRFSVYEYQSLAIKKIYEINSRGKLPILVGGTGLYIDSVIKNYSLAKSSNNPGKRNELEKLDMQELQELAISTSKDRFEALNYSDQNNPRRLIRLIEKTDQKSLENKENKFETLFLYPEYNWDDLKVKIEKRVDEMFKEGLIEETRKIIELGFDKLSPGLQTMGYKQVIEYLDDKIDFENCVERVKISHKQYARRQRTWFEGKGRSYELVRIEDNLQNLILKFIK